MLKKLQNSYKQWYHKLFSVWVYVLGYNHAYTCNRAVYLCICLLFRTYIYIYIYIGVCECICMYSIIQSLAKLVWQAFFMQPLSLKETDTVTQVHIMDKAVLILQSPNTFGKRMNSTILPSTMFKLLDKLFTLILASHPVYANENPNFSFLLKNWPFVSSCLYLWVWINV